MIIFIYFPTLYIFMFLVGQLLNATSINMQNSYLAFHTNWAKICVFVCVKISTNSCYVSCINKWIFVKNLIK